MQTIQVGAARVLSELLIVADYLQQYSFGNACFGLDDKQVCILCLSLFSYFPWLDIVLNWLDKLFLL